MGWHFATSMVPEESLLHPEFSYHGSLPIGEVSGGEAYLSEVSEPMARAFDEASKLPYLFLTGVYRGSIWSAATGNIVGTMNGDWLGVPAARASRTLRFGEFYRIEDGKVVEIRCLLDILGLAAQCGIRLLPPFGGKDQIPPGPRRGLGLLEDGAACAADGETTYRLVMEMIGGCNRLEGSDLASQGLDTFWHDDMVWHGPWGIGSAYGMEAFYKHAQGPSVRAFPNRRGALPKHCFIAEGMLSAQTGWPALVGTFDGEPFRGIQPTGKRIGQNVMDFYVRDGNRLAENWVLIDLVRFAQDCGVDLMASIRA